VDDGRVEYAVRNGDRLFGMRLEGENLPPIVLAIARTVQAAEEEGPSGRNVRA